jgi:hypothetical protein
MPLRHAIVDALDAMPLHPRPLHRLLQNDAPRRENGAERHHHPIQETQI